jgi:hypothetical protein
MHRKIIPLLAAAVLLASAAHAQVAVPGMEPGAPRYTIQPERGYNGATITPDNPAALQWGGPSRVVAGYLKDDADMLGTADDGKGYLLGFRGVWERLGLGLEQLRVVKNGGAFEDDSSVQLSVRVFDFLSLGVGKERAHHDSVGSFTQIDETDYGLSLRLARVFYVGYAKGTHDYSASGVFTPDSRDVTQYGVALRTEGAWRWLLSYDRMKKEYFAVGGSPGMDSKTSTIQLLTANWLLGIAQSQVADLGFTLETKTRYLDLGWVPEKAAWSYTARISSAERVSGVITQNTGHDVALMIGYRF